MRTKRSLNIEITFQEEEVEVVVKRGEIRILGKGGFWDSQNLHSSLILNLGGEIRFLSGLFDISQARKNKNFKLDNFITFI